MAGPAAKPATPATVNIEGHQIKRLSTTEQEERCRLGLCYNCDDRYTRGHNKVCKRLFLLESALEDDDTEDGDTAEDDQTVESPAYSPHAVAGVHAHDTL